VPSKFDPLLSGGTDPDNGHFAIVAEQWKLEMHEVFLFLFSTIKPKPSEELLRKALIRSQTGSDLLFVMARTVLLIGTLALEMGCEFLGMTSFRTRRRILAIAETGGVFGASRLARTRIRNTRTVFPASHPGKTSAICRTRILGTRIARRSIRTIANPRSRLSASGQTTAIRIAARRSIHSARRALGNNLTRSIVGTRGVIRRTGIIA
jgi:hypothetical protein